MQNDLEVQRMLRKIKGYLKMCNAVLFQKVENASSDTKASKKVDRLIPSQIETFLCM